MNIKYTVFFTGRILKIVAFLFLFPTLIAIIYGEYDNFVAFLPLGAGVFLLGAVCSLKEPSDKRLSASEGFIIVASSWVLLSLFVASAYRITGEIGNFVNCFFEAVSGFTTTGATVVSNVEGLSYSVNALRLFTHWVGGMGILVLVLAIVPKNQDATTMNIFKAEVPGHSVEKFTSKLAVTAKILYLIYTGLTVVLAVSFIIAKMPVFDSVVHAMSIAGTGGFSVKNGSLGSYNSLAIEIIATVGMFVFGINMNIFYLILIGKFTAAIKSEELRVYALIFVFSVLIMATELTLKGNYSSFGQSLRYVSFQTASIMSTTGMYVVDFAYWTALCHAIIFILMFIGGSSGSTAGGLKVSRIVIVSKYIRNQFYVSARPNRIKTIKFEGERLDDQTVSATMAFFGIYITTVLVSLVSVALFDDIMVGGGNTFTEKLTAVVTCISNVGPGFGKLTTESFNGFSAASKIVLSFDMLAGRLEILPMLYLFNPKTWLGK